MADRKISGAGGASASQRFAMCPQSLGSSGSQAPCRIPGIAFRLISSLVPLAALWITKLIIDGIVLAVSSHQPVKPVLWWLVAAEFGVAVFGSILGRTIDYFDALLADKYTRHVSIRGDEARRRTGSDRHTKIQFSTTGSNGRACKPPTGWA